MKIVILLVSLFISNTAFAYHDEWTENDTKWQAAYLTLHTIDWGQTRYIASHPEQYFELNPLLGEHPTKGRVDGYFATAALIHTGIAYVLPSEWRRKFQYVTIGIEGSTVNKNYSLGIKTSF